MPEPDRNNLGRWKENERTGAARNIRSLLCKVSQRSRSLSGTEGPPSRRSRHLISADQSNYLTESTFRPTYPHHYQAALELSRNRYSVLRFFSDADDTSSMRRRIGIAEKSLSAHR